MNYQTIFPAVNTVIITALGFIVAFESASVCQDEVPRGIERVLPSMNVPNDNFPNDNVPVEGALRSAWAATIRKSNQPASLSLARFLGFAEGRLYVKVPAWWEDMMFSVNAELGYLRFDPGNASSRLMGKHKVRTSAGVVVAVAGEQMEVIVNGLRVNLSSRVASGMRIRTVSALTGKNALYFVLASDTPCNSELMKVSLDGRIIWKAVVSGDLQPLSHSGRPFHFVEPVFGEDDRIHVFGGGGNCLYIESFDGDTGLRAVRFFTPTMLKSHE